MKGVSGVELSCEGELASAQFVCAILVMDLKRTVCGGGGVRRGCTYRFVDVGKREDDIDRVIIYYIWCVWWRWKGYRTCSFIQTGRTSGVLLVFLKDLWMWWGEREDNWLFYIYFYLLT